MAKNVLVLKHFESPKEAGVYHRLVCLTGNNKGESYVLTGNRIVIGRSEKADIRLTDSKTSREHCELTKVADYWVATDLGSQNGIVVNDAKINQQALKEGDKLIVGQTVFKFARVEVAAKKKVERSDDDESSGNSKKTMVPFIILLVIFAAVVLLDDSDKKVTGPEDAKKAGIEDMTDDLVGNLKKKLAKDDKQAKEKLNTIYQRGLREFREGNYFRAIQEFNLALIIAPGDAQAEYYLRKTKEKLDNSIEGYNQQGERDKASLKYNGAIISYCQIIRLLYSVPEDKRYKTAEDEINKLELLLGQEKGETDCLKKQRTNQ